jgi:Mg2+ and Co2+ transporter CorA
MSKDLARYEVELERKAQEKVGIIRKVIKEYNASLQSSDNGRPNHLQREIERVVAEYIQLYKALKRLRKKMRAGK